MLKNQVYNVDETDVEFFCDATRIQRECPHPEPSETSRMDTDMWDACHEVTGNPGVPLANVFMDGKPLFGNKPFGKGPGREIGFDEWIKHSSHHPLYTNSFRYGVQFCMPVTQWTSIHNFANPEFRPEDPLLGWVRAQSEMLERSLPPLNKDFLFHAAPDAYRAAGLATPGPKEWLGLFKSFESTLMHEVSG